MIKRELILQMIREGVKVVAISEALGVSRVRVYEVKRGYTKKQKIYRNHFINGHSFQKNCKFCLKEQQNM